MRCFPHALALWGAAFLVAANAGAATSTFDTEVAVAKAAMMGDPASALRAADRAATMGDDDEAVATALWLQAEALTRLGRPAAAFERIERARRLPRLPRKLAGDLSLAEARAHSQDEVEATALGAFQDAYAAFVEVGDERGQAMALVGIANLYMRARRGERALDYLAQARDAYDADDGLALVIHNNEGAMLREFGRAEEAQRVLQTNLPRAARLGTPFPIVNTHLKLADVALDLGDIAAAREHVAATTAYAGSPSAEAWRRLALLVRARLAVAEGEDAVAERLFSEIFAGWDGTEIVAANQRSHALAAAFYERQRDLPRALAHAKALARIDADLNGAAAANSFNLLNAEFEAANRELEIERLNSARLEAEVAATLARERTRSIVTGVLGLAAVGVLLTVLWHLRSAWRAAAALREANAELEEANEAKTRFLANTSHEIRTPLNAVLGMTEAMLTDTDEPLAPRHRERLGTIQRSGTLLLGVVSDILDASKMEAGKLGARLAPTDLGAVARNLAAMHGPNAEAKGLDLALDLPDDLPGFVTDERLVTQAVGNLVGNAVKFTEAGTVTVSVRALHGGFEVRVADTGIGIPQDKLEAVFEPFAQAEAGAARRFGGTGLGLSIVRSIAGLLGGTVRAEREPGGGARFTLRVPAARAELAVPAPRADDAALPPGAEALAPLRVLLAEDNPVNVQVVRALIGGLVATLDVAENGSDAVELVRMQPYDVILMDNQMPGMSGAQATAIVRRMPDHADLPIIGVTGDVAPPVRQALMEAGMTSIVAKPVSRAGLIAAMTEAVTKRRAERSAA